MEIKSESPAWLDPSHPNYKRWERSRSLSLERGKFVRSVIEQKQKIKNLTVVDLGSGEGGTSKIFAEDNFVVSIDLSLIRLQRQNHSGFKFSKINADAIHLHIRARTSGRSLNMTIMSPATSTGRPSAGSMGGR